MSKLWGGRFNGATDALMEKFNASLPFDRRLYEVDVRGSQAYATGLLDAGLLSVEEHRQLQEGLERVLQEWKSNTFVTLASDEDIHTANERRLQELVGSVAGKLHTGRSRNDQVATDMRLWLLEASGMIGTSLRQLMSCLVERAASEMDIVMPGYTHLQRAQPIRWSQWVLSHAWTFDADLKRLEALQLASRSRGGLTSCPLGSGAIAGNPFGLDRAKMASALGFSGGVTPNSLYGVGDRDFVADFLYTATMIMLHLSRLAEDLILYSSSEFGFVTLADAYSTGSSLMPQKKNPDSLELLRGKCGRVAGHLTGFLMTYKGLPSTYNKDLQEDKEPFLDAYDTLVGSLHITTGVIATLTLHPDRMRQALSEEMLATDLAEYLVRQHVPFRQAHHYAGQIVSLSEQRGCRMSQLPLSEYQKVCPAFKADVVQKEWWDMVRSIESRNVVGGTSRCSIERQLTELRAVLGEQRQ